MITKNIEKNRAFTKVVLNADYVVAGGGLTGVCSAIAAAREGLRAVLIQDRPVLGGNASSEVRLWALGATSHMGNNNRWSREGGIIDEILVENVYRNKEGNPVLFDMVLMDKVLAEKNITLLLNTTLYKVDKGNDRNISSVTAINSQNGTEYSISGQMFADCTGDGTLGYLAGASFRMGAEGRAVYGEEFAPDKQEYGELLGHSILFYTKDIGKPVEYIAPNFALKNVETLIPKLQNPNYFNVNQLGCKYWWLEYGGRLNTILDTEEIKYELWKVVYGVWDYIKNSGKFPQAKTLTLEWVGLFPGKRESRRFNGLYTLTQQDVINQSTHYDAVAYGGWAIDLHPADGVYAEGNGCHQWHSKGVYQIPYRCYVTPDLDNLFVGGRIISSSHVANGTTRVMCTAALGGEVIGRAASICLSKGYKPIDLVDKDKIGLLQSLLVKNGNFIPGIAVAIEDNFVYSAEISVSSVLKLDDLPTDGTWFGLDYPVAQLIPVNGKVPVIRMNIKANNATRLVMELRSSSKSENYTPDTVDSVIEFDLKKGENEIIADFSYSYTAPRYAFICLMKNSEISVPMSGRLVTGLTTVYNYINPAVSNFGKQIPPEGIGVEEFEFWCPKRRPENKNIAMSFVPALTPFGSKNLKSSYYRPYIGTNAWVAAFDDARPEVCLKWNERKQIKSIILYFDTDTDQAMETVQMGHFDACVPTCYREYIVRDSEGKELCHITDNHQTVNMLELDKPVMTDTIYVNFVRPYDNVCPGLMGIYVC